MTKFNTGNPVGSADPRDLSDNASVADNLVTGEAAYYRDRLGKHRKSWRGIESEFAAFIAAGGYVGTGPDGAVENYAAGIEITRYNQIVRDASGEFWRLSGPVALPYTTTGAGLPEGGAFVAVGDAALRQELNGPPSSGKGAAIVNGAAIYVGSVAELKALTPSPNQQARLNFGGKLFNYVFLNSDLSTQLSPFLSATPAYTQGLYVAPATDTTGASGAWVLLIENNEVDLAVFGIKGGDGISYELSPIFEWAETNGVNVVGRADLENPIEFTDSFNVANINFGSKDPIHLKYVGPDIDDLPVIYHGNNDINTYGPARFASAKQYQVGEALVFSGGSYGDVLYTMGGYVYFKSHLDGAAFPVNGETVTGQTSGLTDTVAGIRPRSFGANFDGVIENVYLTTDLTLDGSGIPTAHKRATGILSIGVRGSRNFGRYSGQIVVQGFKRGVVAHSCYFAKGDELVANRCGDGVLLTEECNAVGIGSISTGTCGTAYDSVNRFSFRGSYSYSLDIGLVGVETTAGAAPAVMCSCYGWSIAGGDIEAVKFSNSMRVEGSPILSEVADPASEANKLIYLRGGVWDTMRGYDSVGLIIGKYIDGLNISNWAWQFSSSPGIAKLSNNIINPSSIAASVTNLRINGVTSNAVDFKEGFENAFDPSKVTMTADCYTYKEVSHSFNKEPTDTSITISDKLFSAAKPIELQSIGLSASKAETSLTFDIFNLENTTSDSYAGIALSGAFAAPDYGSYVNEALNLVNYDTKGFRMRIQGFATSQNYVHFSARLRYIDI